MKTKKNIKSILLFYTALGATFSTVMAITQTNINAYSQPATASFYTEYKSYSPASEIFNVVSTTEEVANVTTPLKETYRTSMDNIEKAKEEEAKLVLLNSLPQSLPASGTITSGFGLRQDPFTGLTQGHNGIDIAVPIGTPIIATSSGTVIQSSYSSSYGHVIEIQHSNNVSTLYAHNSSLHAEVGDYVEKGQLIAYSGNTGMSTGPHLHYELAINDTPIDPLSFDPLMFLE